MAELKIFWKPTGPALPNQILIFHLLWCRQVRGMSSSRAVRLSLFGCPGLVQNSPTEPETLLPAPWLDFTGLWLRFYLRQVSCHFTRRWRVSTYAAVSSFWLGPPTWGGTGTQSAHNSLNKIFTTHSCTPALGLDLTTMVLECRFPLQGIGKYLVFYNPSCK